MTDPTGKSRGFGFVSYEKHEDANKVLWCDFKPFIKSFIAVFTNKKLQRHLLSSGSRGHEWHRAQRQDRVCGSGTEEDGAPGRAEEEIWAAETRKNQSLSGLSLLFCSDLMSISMLIMLKTTMISCSSGIISGCVERVASVFLVPLFLLAKIPYTRLLLYFRYFCSPL